MFRSLNKSFFCFVLATVVAGIAIVGIYAAESIADESGRTEPAEQSAVKQRLITTVRDIETHVENVEKVVVPVGGIIMWWGHGKKIPPGFELCDGKPPAPGSILNSKKPNLQDQFVKGVAVGETLGTQGGNHKDSHTHGGATQYSNHAGPSQGTRFNSGVTLPEKQHTHNFLTSVNSNHETSYYNNAPRFVSVHFIIRVR